MLQNLSKPALSKTLHCQGGANKNGQNFRAVSPELELELETQESSNFASLHITLPILVSA